MSEYSDHHLQLADVHDLGHELQVVAVGSAAEHAQPLLAQPLEAVRRTSRLEGAAAQHLGAGPLHRRGRGLDLLFVLRRAGTRHDDHFVTANPHVADGDHAVLRLERPAGELVRLGDADDLLDSFEHFEEPRIPLPPATDRANHRAQRAARPVHIEPHLDQLRDHPLHLFVRRPFLHDHNHNDLRFTSECFRRVPGFQPASVLPPEGGSHSPTPNRRTSEPPNPNSNPEPRTRTRTPNPEPRIPNPESRIPSPEPRVPNPQSRVPTPPPHRRSAPGGGLRR